jgi:hypothetical protein
VRGTTPDRAVLWPSVGGGRSNLNDYSNGSFAAHLTAKRQFGMDGEPDYGALPSRGSTRRAPSPIVATPPPKAMASQKDSIARSLACASPRFVKIDERSGRVFRRPQSAKTVQPPVAASPADTLLGSIVGGQTMPLHQEQTRRPKRPTSRFVQASPRSRPAQHPSPSVHPSMVARASSIVQEWDARRGEGTAGVIMDVTAQVSTHRAPLSWGGGQDAASMDATIHSNLLGRFETAAERAARTALEAAQVSEALAGAVGPGTFAPKDYPLRQVSPPTVEPAPLASDQDGMDTEQVVTNRRALPPATTVAAATPVVASSRFPLGVVAPGAIDSLRREVASRVRVAEEAAVAAGSLVGSFTVANRLGVPGRWAEARRISRVQDGAVMSAGGGSLQHPVHGRAGLIQWSMTQPSALSTLREEMTKALTTALRLEAKTSQPLAAVGKGKESEAKVLMQRLLNALSVPVEPASVGAGKLLLEAGVRGPAVAVLAGSEVADPLLDRYKRDKVHTGGALGLVARDIPSTAEGWEAVAHSVEKGQVSALYRPPSVEDVMSASSVSALEAEESSSVPAARVLEGATLAKWLEGWLRLEGSGGDPPEESTMRRLEEPVVRSPSQELRTGGGFTSDALLLEILLREAVNTADQPRAAPPLHASLALSALERIEPMLGQWQPLVRAAREVLGRAIFVDLDAAMQLASGALRTANDTTELVPMVWGADRLGPALGVLRGAGSWGVARGGYSRFGLWGIGALPPVLIRPRHSEYAVFIATPFHCVVRSLRRDIASLEIRAAAAELDRSFLREELERQQGLFSSTVRKWQRGLLSTVMKRWHLNARGQRLRHARMTRFFRRLHANKDAIMRSIFSRWRRASGLSRSERGNDSLAQEDFRLRGAKQIQFEHSRRLQLYKDVIDRSRETLAGLKDAKRRFASRLGKIQAIVAGSGDASTKLPSGCHWARAGHSAVGDTLSMLYADAEALRLGFSEENPVGPRVGINDVLRFCSSPLQGSIALTAKDAQVDEATWGSHSTLPPDVTGAAPSRPPPSSVPWPWNDISDVGLDASAASREGSRGAVSVEWTGVDPTVLVHEPLGAESVAQGSAVGAARVLKSDDAVPLYLEGKRALDGFVSVDPESLRAAARAPPPDDAWLHQAESDARRTLRAAEAAYQESVFGTGEEKLAIDDAVQIDDDEEDEDGPAEQHPAIPALAASAAWAALSAIESVKAATTAAALRTRRRLEVVGATPDDDDSLLRGDPSPAKHSSKAQRAAAAALHQAALNAEKRPAGFASGDVATCPTSLQPFVVDKDSSSKIISEAASIATEWSDAYEQVMRRQDHVLLMVVKRFQRTQRTVRLDVLASERVQRKRQSATVGGKRIALSDAPDMSIPDRHASARQERVVSAISKIVARSQRQQWSLSPEDWAVTRDHGQAAERLGPLHLLGRFRVGWAARRALVRLPPAQVVRRWLDAQTAWLSPYLFAELHRRGSFGLGASDDGETSPAASSKSDMDESASRLAQFPSSSLGKHLKPFDWTPSGGKAWPIPTPRQVLGLRNVQHDPHFSSKAMVGDFDPDSLQQLQSEWHRSDREWGLNPEWRSVWTARERAAARGRWHALVPVEHDDSSDSDTELPSVPSLHHLNPVTGVAVGSHFAATATEGHSTPTSVRAVPLSLRRWFGIHYPQVQTPGMEEGDSRWSMPVARIGSPAAALPPAPPGWQSLGDYGAISRMIAAHLMRVLAPSVLAQSHVIRHESKRAESPIARALSTVVQVASRDAALAREWSRARSLMGCVHKRATDLSFALEQSCAHTLAPSEPPPRFYPLPGSSSPTSEAVDEDDDDAAVPPQQALQLASFLSSAATVQWMMAEAMGINFGPAFQALFRHMDDRTAPMHLVPSLLALQLASAPLPSASARTTGLFPLLWSARRAVLSAAVPGPSVDRRFALRSGARVLAGANECEMPSRLVLASVRPKAEAQGSAAELGAQRWFAVYQQLGRPLPPPSESAESVFSRFREFTLLRSSTMRQWVVDGPIRALGWHLQACLPSGLLPLGVVRGQSRSPIPLNSPVPERSLHTVHPHDDAERALFAATRPTFVSSMPIDWESVDLSQSQFQGDRELPAEMRSPYTVPSSRLTEHFVGSQQLSEQDAEALWAMDSRKPVGAHLTGAMLATVMPWLRLFPGIPRPASSNGKPQGAMAASLHGSWGWTPLLREAVAAVASEARQWIPRSPTPTASAAAQRQASSKLEEDDDEPISFVPLKAHELDPSDDREVQSMEEKLAARVLLPPEPPASFALLVGKTLTPSERALLLAPGLEPRTTHAMLQNMAGNAVEALDATELALRQQAATEAAFHSAVDAAAKCSWTSLVSSAQSAVQQREQRALAAAADLGEATTESRGASLWRGNGGTATVRVPEGAEGCWDDADTALRSTVSAMPQSITGGQGTDWERALRPGVFESISTRRVIDVVVACCQDAMRVELAAKVSEAAVSGTDLDPETLRLHRKPVRQLEVSPSAVTRAMKDLNQVLSAYSSLLRGTFRLYATLGQKRRAAGESKELIMDYGSFQRFLRETEILEEAHHPSTKSKTPGGWRRRAGELGARGARKGRRASLGGDWSDTEDRQGATAHRKGRARDRTRAAHGAAAQSSVVHAIFQAGAAPESARKVHLAESHATSIFALVNRPLLGSASPRARVSPKGSPRSASQRAKEAVEAYDTQGGLVDSEDEDVEATAVLSPRGGGGSGTLADRRNTSRLAIDTVFSGRNTEPSLQDMLLASAKRWDAADASRGARARRRFRGAIRSVMLANRSRISPSGGETLTAEEQRTDAIARALCNAGGGGRTPQRSPRSDSDDSSSEEKQDPELQVEEELDAAEAGNPSDALTPREFVEALIRLAVRRYSGTRDRKTFPSLAARVRRLIEGHVLRGMHASEPSVFRRTMQGASVQAALASVHTQVDRLFRGYLLLQAWGTAALASRGGKSRAAPSPIQHASLNGLVYSSWLRLLSDAGVVPTANRLRPGSTEIIRWAQQHRRLHARGKADSPDSSGMHLGFSDTSTGLISGTWTKLWRMGLRRLTFREARRLFRDAQSGEATRDDDDDDDDEDDDDDDDEGHAEDDEPAAVVASKTGPKRVHIDPDNVMIEPEMREALSAAATLCVPDPLMPFSARLSVFFRALAASPAMAVAIEAVQL